MTPDFKKQWTAALRSGKYEQWFGGWVDNASCPNAFCCLSVALTEAGRFTEWAEVLSVVAYSDDIIDVAKRERARRLLQIDHVNFSKLIEMNDQKLLTFNEIADWIDANDLGSY